MNAPLRFVLIALVGACSVPPPEQAKSEPLLEPEPVTPPAPEPEPAPSPKPAKPKSDDHPITLRDCEALARTYAKAWLHDETTTLDAQKLSEAEHAKVQAQLGEDARGMYDNYYDQCAGTEGTVYLWSRLQCATNARTMKRFDDCLEGRADTQE